MGARARVDVSLHVPSVINIAEQAHHHRVVIVARASAWVAVRFTLIVTVVIDPFWLTLM